MITRNRQAGYSTGHRHAFTFEIASTERSTIESNHAQQRANAEWEYLAFELDNYKVIPYGTDNNLPIEIRETVNAHNLAPRIFTKKKLLLWGEGPVLYQTTLQNELPGINYVQDQEVQNWLQSWGYEQYLRKAIEDFNHSEGVFSKITMARSTRIGKPQVAKIEHISAHQARLAIPATTEIDHTPPPTAILVGNWARHWVNKYKPYPIFNPQQPAKHKVSAHYAHMYGFASPYYARPDVVGSLAWIRRSTAIPFILEALTNNSLNIKWHIISPAKYWEAQEEALQNQATQSGKVYNPQDLEDLKDQIFSSLSEVLSGQQNVGKFFQSEAFYEIIGTTAIEHKWEIIPIDQKIKDYVDAQLEISKRGDFATVAGLGLHQALSNIGGDGKSDSGSEQLYALKNHLLSEVALPTSIICEAINHAMQINWPNKNLKLGFYHPMPEREEDITTSKRISNAV